MCTYAHVYIQTCMCIHIHTIYVHIYIYIYIIHTYIGKLACPRDCPIQIDAPIIDQVDDSCIPYTPNPKPQP